MNRMGWIIFLRFSIYVYFVLAIIMLLVLSPSHIDPRFPTLVFAAGLVWFVLSRLAGNILFRLEAREHRLLGDLTAGPLGELPDAKRPVDEERVRAAMSRLDEFAGGCPAWLRAGVDEWLAAAEGPDKSRMRDELLKKLYAEACAPGDPQQRRALNQVRLAINPWVGEA
jgi:hypothetical protein